jgi:SAM-dependent methyltransferase
MLTKDNTTSWKLLQKDLWNKDKHYYELAEKSITNGVRISFGLQRLRKIAWECNTVLDCGCGSGKLLKLIYHRGARYQGIDISKLAIRRGRRRIKNKKAIKLSVGNIEKLAYNNDTFDLVYSTYTLEHVDNPDKAVEEMIRVTKPGGRIVCLCPNFGCPQWGNPSMNISKPALIVRAVRQLVKAYWSLVGPGKKLGWMKINPGYLKTGKYLSDTDATNEPYLGSLIPFLKRRKVIIIEVSSGWEWPRSEPLETVKSGWGFAFIRQLFMKMGKGGLMPYKYFGPDLFVVGKKR